MVLAETLFSMLLSICNMWWRCFKMNLLTKGRTQMTLTPGSLPVTAPANTVQGPEQGQWTYEDYPYRRVTRRMVGRKYWLAPNPLCCCRRAYFSSTLATIFSTTYTPHA